jgi:dipeptidyl aminopeptidase/acylaminoacyl peptidase
VSRNPLPNRRPLELADLADLKNVSDPQISPDGEAIAFVVETIDPATNEERQRIWVVDALGTADPRPFTSGEKQDTYPRWSPDGGTLAFVSNRSGSEQIWLIDVRGGEPQQLTRRAADVLDPAWSPDGTRLSFVADGPADRRDPLVMDETDGRKRIVRVREYRHRADGRGYFGTHRRHIWTVDAATGATTQLTDGGADDGSPAWSPNGEEIAFVSDRSPERDWHWGGEAIHVVSVATGDVRRLSAENGRAAHPSWSPDGRFIAYPGTTQPDESSPFNTRLWIVDAATSKARSLTDDLDQSVGQRPSGYLTPSPPVWTPDGKALLYLIGDGSSTHVWRIDVASGSRTRLTSGRCSIQTISASRDTSRLALLVADPVTPSEVWVAGDGIADQRPTFVIPSGSEKFRTVSGHGIGARPVTAMNRDLLDQLELTSPRDLQIVRPDGTVIDGWLLAAPRRGDGPHPLIFSVHGGPHNYFGDTFYFDHHLYAAQGYAVLYLNPRGSGGKSEAFAQAVVRDWGGEDFQDLMAMLDDVIERGDPPIDSRRLGITGGSYGGFMTCWAITQTDRFAAAVAGAPVTNLLSGFGTGDLGATWGVREQGGEPAERIESYLGRSPVMHVARVTTPLLLYHGESDLTVPITQAEEMFTALLRRGKTVELIRIPGESHGSLSGTPTHRLVVRQAILDWFGKYLGAR